MIKMMTIVMMTRKSNGDEDDDDTACKSVLVSISERMGQKGPWTKKITLLQTT